MRTRLALLLCLPIGLAAQAPPFTPEDALDAKTSALADLSEDGRWLALTVSSTRHRLGIDNSRFGDPSYLPPARAELWVIDTQTGSRRSVLPAPRDVRGIRWSPDGARLALALRVGDEVLPHLWDRASGALKPIPLPPGKVLAHNGDPVWTPGSNQLLLPLRNQAWVLEVRAMFLRLTQGPVVVLSSQESFLDWEKLRRLAARRSLHLYDLASAQWRELTPDQPTGEYRVTRDGSSLVWESDITGKTDYDTIFGSEHKVQLQPLAGGPAATLVPSTKGLTLTWSADARTYAYAKEGAVYTGTVDASEARFLLGRKPPVPGEKKDPDAKPDPNESYSAVRLSPDGSRLVVSNKQGLWIASTAGGEKELFLKVDDDDKLAPRHSVLAWSPASTEVYLSYASRTAWERGLVRYHLASKQLADVFKDGRRYDNLRLSRDGSTLVAYLGEGARPGDWHATPASTIAWRRLTDLNPQLDPRLLPQSRLVSYLDVEGRTLHGVLYLPPGAEAGKKLPTVFHIYEQFFDDGFNPADAILASAGYAVFQPSVEFETGFPGEAWLKGVTAAANKLIELGIADPGRLAVMGTSYGGYATNLLITQTNRFKAAINISGKVNMISFYTDSPRLGVRNIHAPEKSQDRLGATLWQQPQKYLAHSAILYADRIKTPLLLLTGEQDHNVPARQAMEMYYALRRLGKTVTWVNYVGGGHGVPTNSLENFHDYWRRITAWLGEHLKDRKTPQP